MRQSNMRQSKINWACKGIITAFIFSFVCTPFTNAFGGERITYSSRKVMNICSSLPSSFVSSADSSMMLRTVTSYCPVVVSRLGNVVYNVGVGVLKPDEVRALTPTVGWFVQRLLLEILLCKDNATAQRRLKEYGIQLVLRGIPQSMPRNSVNEYLKLCSKPYSFGFDSRDKYMKLTWHLVGMTTFSLSFPMSRELVEGTDKGEADEAVARALNTSTIESQPPCIKQIRKTDCEATAGSPILTLPGLAYSIKNMRSDTYYMESKQSLIPVFSVAYLAESVKNIFLGAVPSHHQLSLIQRGYGNHTTTLKLPLTTFLNYWLNKPEFKCYCGTNILR
jgi:hypothetical protein